ncbi:M20 family metallopeptidase [Desulfovibrio sp. OttesenSCG-928-O18]|nr:M20 family metallopeptidase [Desulfovibrio sp. OttesenSCG-928-O18]
MDIARKTAEIIAYVTDLRRHFHEHPEPGMREFATTRRVIEELRKLPGMEVRDTAPGCIGVLRGKYPGKAIALRADLDALPLVEESGLPFASKTPGVCHACGHDLHTAILIGVATVLASLNGEFGGAVTFIFQPGQELFMGARYMIDKGALDAPKVDAIIGLHTWPLTPVGSIGLKRGPMMASLDTIDILVSGKAGHAAQPHRAVDAIFMAGHIITALQGIVSRETDPLESLVVALGTVNGGTFRNIIAPEVRLEGSVRTHSAAVRDAVPQKIRDVISGVTAAFGGTAELEYTRCAPPLINDDAMLDVIEAAAAAVIGRERITALPLPVMGAEDFSCYLEHVPGAFFRLGTAADDSQTQLVPHDPRIRYDEKAIPVGINVLCRAALDYCAM